MLSSNITIRPASEADCSAIARLLWQLGCPTAPEQVASRLALLAASGLDHVLVAVADGRVVGFASFHIFPLLNEDGNIAHLTALVVEEDWRRCGIGRSLVAKVERIAREAGCLRMKITSSKRRSGAHAFYRSLGYEGISYKFHKSL